MGAWGNSIYSDDDAQDARDAYQSLLSKGLDGPEATDQFLKDWKESLDDSDDGPTIWFALAETQWKLGRLVPRVRDKAIRIIDNGSSLDRWREGGERLVVQHKKVLDALKSQLLKPQPARKVTKVKRPSRAGEVESAAAQTSLVEVVRRRALHPLVGAHAEEARHPLRSHDPAGGLY